MTHLIDIKDLTAQNIKTLFKHADKLQSMNPAERQQKLPGRSAICLFYENSTRTLMSFQLAAQNIGMHVTALPMNQSSIKKGESFDDTLKTLAAMQPDVLIMRHPDNHIHQHVKSYLPDDIHLINAGDGQNQHPTQGLLDLYTISKHKPNFESLKITLIGDIKHSRVANSLIDGLTIMGHNDLHLFGPDAFMPAQHKAKVSQDMNTALKDSDVVVMLRIQKERLAEDEHINIDSWHRQYGLDAEKLTLAKPDAIVMHPGPINRGIEITGEVADGRQSVILEQVRNGVLIRQALIHNLCRGR